MKVVLIGMLLVSAVGCETDARIIGENKQKKSASFPVLAVTCVRKVWSKEGEEPCQADAAFLNVEDCKKWLMYTNSLCDRSHPGKVICTKCRGPSGCSNTVEKLICQKGNEKYLIEF